MMQNAGHILLLMSAREAEHFSERLKASDPALTCKLVENVADMEQALDEIGENQPSRLISFCARIIVPEHILKALNAGAYNFHPGPPSYPGSCAANFAIYNGEEYFGATLHEMEKRVDEGKIIDLISFDVPNSMDAAGLSHATYKTLLTLFERHASNLSDLSKPLATINLPWAGVKTTKADAKKLSVITDDLSSEETARRVKAFSDLTAQKSE